MQKSLKMSTKIKERTIELIVKSCDEASQEITIESTETFNKTKVNEHKQLSTNFYKSCTGDFNIIKQIEELVPNINNLKVLKLSKCSLEEIPLELKILRLKQLDLSHNKLLLIPQCLYQGLKELQYLNLSHNKISNFSIEPLCVDVLKLLDISHCDFKNPPSWFLEMRSGNLEEFIYNNNDLSKMVPLLNPVGMCNLKTIEFKNCHLRNEDLVFFKSIHTLECLNLSNEHSGNFNSFLDFNHLLKRPAWTSQIQVIKCNNLGISEIPPDIILLTQLKELHLENNCIINLPNELVQLEQLTHLNLSQNSLFFIPENFNRLTNLQVFKAALNNIATINLSAMPRLKYVDLYSNEIDYINLDSDVDFIDLDDNYIKNFDEICANYASKRDNLRSTFSAGSGRKLGSKSENIESERHSSSGTTSYSYESQNDLVGNVDYYQNDEEECWDSWECRNGGVTLSDNEYSGCEIQVQLKSDCNVKKIDDVNEDFLYVDAE